MRVVIVTESFPPDVNGVSHCALQTVLHLARRGHEPLVVAPAPPPGTRVPDDVPCPVVHVPSLPLPGYPQVRVALPGRRMAAALDRHRPDVVHLASPFVLGARAAAAAARRGLPSVAVFQTDMAGYARMYVGGGERVAWRRIRTIHAASDLTLAPSTDTMEQLRAHGVPRVRLWGRGVDTGRFRPALRDDELRRELAPDGELLVGYVGRLAPEKRIDLLSGVCALPGVRVVVVGDGPSEPGLRTALPGAHFLGRRTGDDLARIVASFDVFAHTGPYETFCQTVLEAQASGVAVVAPAVGGPRDLVEHERTGLLFPPDDGDALTDAVRTLAGSRPLRTGYANAALTAARDRTWEAVGDQLLAHYDALADRRARAAA